MIYKDRVFRVATKVLGVEIGTNTDYLAKMLTEHDWCACNGFRLGQYILLNDSSSADGAQEYAIFKDGESSQIESITVSWMTREQLKLTLDKILEGHYDPVIRDAYVTVRPSLEHPEGSCIHCA